MPKQTRWQIKRVCDQALNDLIRAQSNLVSLGVMFEPVHPDLYEELCVLVVKIESLKTPLIEFRDKI